MVTTPDELFAALRDAGVPIDPGTIWRSEVPAAARYTVQSPATEFDAFVRHPEMFPCDDLLILWCTNGDSVVGYAPSMQCYIRYYLEDGPERFTVLGSTFQQLMAGLFASMISRGKDDAALNAMADFFRFQYLPELKIYLRTEEIWETNAPQFIASLEAARR